MRIFPKSCSRLRVFLSYAREDVAPAEAIAVRLQNAKHKVFIDTQGLGTGEHFDERIREEIHASDRFIFLVSRNSIELGAYTLTEMKFARERMAAVKRFILPVLVDDALDLTQLPASLAAHQILQPQGNLPAEVAAAVEAGARIKPSCRLTLAAICLMTCTAAAYAVSDRISMLLGQSNPGIDIAVAPPAKINFRPLKDPLNNPATAMQSTTTLSAISFEYTHRSEPGKKIRISFEDANLKLADRNIQFDWLYFVDIRDGCQGGAWICDIAPAAAATLNPGDTLPRQTLFRPRGSVELSWQQFIDTLLAADTQTLEVRFEVALDLPDRPDGADLEKRTFTCIIDLQPLQTLIREYVEKQQRLPRWLQPDCKY